uniref:Protein HIR1 n=1 Tax=Lygus hesperus TaxID=30085 RepID=A0A0A9W811_LYGHE
MSGNVSCSWQVSSGIRSHDKGIGKLRSEDNSLVYQDPVPITVEQLPSHEKEDDADVFPSTVPLLDDSIDREDQVTTLRKSKQTPKSRVFPDFVTSYGNGRRFKSLK